MSNPNFILSSGAEAFRVSQMKDLEYNHLIKTGAAFINSTSPATNNHIYRDLVPKESCTEILIPKKELEIYKFKKIYRIRTYGKYLVLEDVCKVFQMPSASAMKFLFLKFYKVQRPKNMSMQTSKIFIDYNGFKDCDWIRHSPGFDKVVTAIETNMIISRKDRKFFPKEL